LKIVIQHFNANHEERDMSELVKNTLNKIGRTVIAFRCLPLLLLPLIVIFSLPAQAGGYTYETVDPLANGLVQVFGLDQTGNITGNIDPGDGERIGFILDTKSGELTLVPEVRVLFDLNNGGLGSAAVTGADFESVCALRDRDGVITTFDPPLVQDGFLTVCEARGRNASGVVSGWEGGVNGWVGFIHDPQMGTFEEFLPTAPNEQTIVGQINARGELAGGVWYRSEDQVYPGSPEGRYGFRRNKNGSFKFFTINGSLQTRARGISDNGLMTGFFLPGDLQKGYVAEVPKGAGFDDISIPDDQVLDPGSCVPVTTPPYLPGPGEEWTADNENFAAAIRNDGVVVGNCDGYWILRDSDGVIVDFEYLGSAGFIATPDW
jgi:hypothetical protein